MNIREATVADSEAIHQLYLQAFPDEESALVSQLATELLSEASNSDVIHWVALSQGAIVGHIACSPVTIKSRVALSAYILAPLAVMPEYQRHGIGTALVEQGVKSLASREVDLLFVYGDPAYYGRFGFEVELAKWYTPPYPLQYPSGWQAMALNQRSVEEIPAPISCVSPLCKAVLW